MSDNSKPTPGRALWEIELPLTDFPKRKPWESLDERERMRFEMKAADILSTAARLMTALYGQPS